VREPPLKGRLLLAAPGLVDPNFDRSVVLVIEHGEDGAVGVVLNRPSETGVGDALPHWEPLAAAPAVVFVGGPVLPTGALALARLVDGADEEGWTPVLGPIGLLDLGSDSDALPSRVDAVRIFAGHAGWSAGQLEGEIAAHGWIVVDADPTDVLHPEPVELWRAVLARQPGRLAWFANCPPDPSVN
jgi:putative transcriptional regulator